MMKTNKIAVIHEWLRSYGGSERVLMEVLRLYPRADLFALTYFPENFHGTPLEKRGVKTSWLQVIPGVEKYYRLLLPLMPAAIESLNMDRYDIVISLSHAVAHGVKTNQGTLHVSYISTPMRYAWHMREEYLQLHGLDKPFLRSAANLTLNLLRHWDKSAASRADHLLANSHWTKQNIKHAWGRDSHVIYPPVDLKRFSPAKVRDDFYLHVSRLVPYKMTAEIIRAFNDLKFPLMIVGDGPEMSRLKKLAKDNISLLGYQTDEVVADLMNRAKAFVYMAVEDFGIAMVEAQAAGCPVFAYARGGALEIVQDGETGRLFQEQTAASLIEAVLNLHNRNLKSVSAVQNAARFSSVRFQKEFSAFMDGLINSSPQDAP